MPIIVLSGKDEDEDMLRGYELGANYYITKPFSKDELFSGIQWLFGESSDPSDYTGFFVKP